MNHLPEYLDSLLARGHAHFSKSDAILACGQSPAAFIAAAARLRKKGRLASPRRGFYLILRPEDRALGAPDPARWIEPFMKHVGVDYRISLLRAATFHGSAHQAAMVFQVIAPRQLPELQIGRQRVQFAYQAPATFEQVNRSEWLDRLKTEAGFAKVAGIELTLLDSIRYFEHAAGINGVAQMVSELGRSADPRVLSKIANSYENSAVRRLGYLLEHFGYQRQAKPLLAFAAQAKSFKPLDPSAMTTVSRLRSRIEQNVTWKLLVNAAMEIDA